jgi:hypothetical protein
MAVGLEYPLTPVGRLEVEYALAAQQCHFICRWIRVDGIN